MVSSVSSGFTPQVTQPTQQPGGNQNNVDRLRDRDESNQTETRPSQTSAAETNRTEDDTQRAISQREDQSFTTTVQSGREETNGSQERGQLVDVTA